MSEIAVHTTDPALAGDDELLDALRLGDERAYVALVRRYGGLMQRVALSYVRTPRGGRGGRPGDVVRRAHGPRALRGPRGAEDVALPHPHQPRQDPRAARGAHGAVLVARSEDEGDGPAVDPIASCPPTTGAGPVTGPPARAQWSAARRAAAGGRAAAADPPRHRRAAPSASRRSSSCATSRAGRPRRCATMLDLSEGNQRVLLHRARSRCAPSSSATSPTIGAVMSRGPRLACNELVELVTAYLEDALAGRRARRFDEHLTECPDCVEYVAQFRRTVAAIGLAAPSSSVRRRSASCCASSATGSAARRPRSC